MLSALSARTSVLLKELGYRSITTSHNAISSGHKPANQLRKPARGGQNLSERYKRLENSLRGKDSRSRGLEDITESNPTITGDVLHALKSKKSARPMIHGFPIPQKPQPPADDGERLSYTALFVALNSLQNAACLDARFAFTTYTKNHWRHITTPWHLYVHLFQY